jgi:hypothetical protein
MAKMNQHRASDGLPSNSIGNESQSLPRPIEPGNQARPNQTAPRRANRAQARVDKGRTHATRNGLLSRNIVQALVRSRENVRTLRRYEKKCRDFFKPRGTLGELCFDRFWSCYLRLYLSAKLEATVLTSDHSRQRSPILPELREGELPTLVSESDPNEYEIGQKFDADFSQDLFRNLALAQRYDAHFAREAIRWAGLLLVMRKGGMGALERLVVDGIDFVKSQRRGK